MRTIVFIFALLYSGAALAGAHEQKLPDAAEFTTAANPEQRQLIEDIESFLYTYAERYNHQDYEALLSMWDRDDAFPMYMAEEVETPMYGWEAINKYFNPLRNLLVVEGAVSPSIGSRGDGSS